MDNFYCPLPLRVFMVLLRGRHCNRQSHVILYSWRRVALSRIESPLPHRMRSNDPARARTSYLDFDPRASGFMAQILIKLQKPFFD